MGLRGTLAFNVFSHPAAAPGPYEALVPREGKFNLERENKALFNSSKSVDAMGFMAVGIWAVGGGRRGQSSTKVACLCPYNHR